MSEEALCPGAKPEKSRGEESRTEGCLGGSDLLLHKEVVFTAPSWIEEKGPYCPKSSFKQIAQAHVRSPEK